MKKIITFITIIATTVIFAQAPQGFNYQATVRNSAGALIVNQNVYFKFNLMLNSATSVPVFSETHYVPTDDLGQVNLVIGSGTATTGTFSTINWGTGNYYLGIELNTGSGYLAMGTTQLLSVPYALYANSSGNAQAATPNLASVLAVNNGANNLQIKNLADPTDAQDALTKNYLDIQVAQLQAQITALQNAYVAPLPNVTIGTQIWSSTNLDVTTYRDGTPIPQVTNYLQWTNLTTGAWRYYNDDPANGSIYGKLYNWYAVAGIYDTASLNDSSLRKQLAPQGWHIPTDEEWTILTDFLGGQSLAGGKMKSTGTSHWLSPNTAATNSSGFTGLPGGYVISGDVFYSIGTNGIWWSSSENDTTPGYSSEYVAWDRYLSFDNSDTGISFGNKVSGFSVRCVRD